MFLVLQSWLILRLFTVTEVTPAGGLRTANYLLRSFPDYGFLPHRCLLNMLLLSIQFFFITEIPAPAGYHRPATDAWGTYLRHLPLKKDPTVYLYNGEKKRNQSAQYAVVDLSVGKQDLQQCADAVIRLRAEYLFAAGQYAKIVFSDNNGKAYRFSAPYTHEHLLQYLNTVFTYCNSASLEKELKPKDIRKISIGDVLIKGGFPGHVVIVVDLVQDAKGNKLFMIAQSYMPAQDIHVLKGQNGPWYKAEEGVIKTPEYTFHSSSLRSF